MQYLALIYSTEGAGPGHDVLLPEYGSYTQEIIAAGVFKAGEALEPIATATSIRIRDGRTQITDGPFAETKEQLGGFYILDCETLDDAIKWAAKIPTSKYGTVEVRPITVFDS